MKASSHDCCFHLVSVQVGQAGAGELGMLAPVHLSGRPTSLLVVALRAPTKPRLINSQARGTRNWSAHQGNTKTTEVSELPVGAGPGQGSLSPALQPLGAGGRASW